MSTKLTPFKVLYGRDPPVVQRLGRGQSPVDTIEVILQERDAMLDELHMNLLKAQQTKKTNADKKRRDDQFAMGDKVYVKLQPYRQQTVACRPYEKMAAKFYGPFEIVQRIGQVAYKLQLPDTSKIHPVLHIFSSNVQLNHCPLVQLFRNTWLQSWNEKQNRKFWYM